MRGAVQLAEQRVVRSARQDLSLLRMALAGDVPALLSALADQQQESTQPLMLLVANTTAHMLLHEFQNTNDKNTRSQLWKLFGCVF
jgi:DNA polymerase III delta subunit